MSLTLGLGLMGSTCNAIPPAPVITTTSPLDAGTQNVAYSKQLAATGQVTTWSLRSGTLPDGVTLSSAGLLSGTPTNSGTFGSLVIRATGPGGYDEETFSLTIAAAGFNDPFTNTGPELDATKWTENTRTGTGTGVNVGSNGLMQCKRVSAGALGIFAGFVTTQFENGSVDTIIMSAVRFSDTSSRIELYVKAANKTANDRDAGGNTGQAYLININPASGSASKIILKNNASTVHQVGTDITLTGLGATAHDVKVVVTTNAGTSVVFDLYVDDVLIATRTDANAGRKEAAGYTGIVEVANVGSGSVAELGNISINA